MNVFLRTLPLDTEAAILIVKEAKSDGLAPQDSMRHNVDFSRDGIYPQPLFLVK